MSHPNGGCVADGVPSICANVRRRWPETEKIQEIFFLIILSLVGFPCGRVVSSLQTIATACVAEAEYIAAFTMGKYALATRQILHAMGYPQPTSPIYCDNLCAVGIANDDVKLKRMKYVDIKYHWLRDRVRSKDLAVLKIPGKTNAADHFQKITP